MSVSKYIGQTINGFTVLTCHNKKNSSGSYNAYFTVRCNVCGSVLERARVNVLKGEVACECSRKFRNHNTQGASDTKLNKVYRTMLERCENPKCKSYKDYGGRGIRVCEEWVKDFQAFYEWSMQNGYKENPRPSGVNELTIDRIDNNGNYEPSNCRWVTMSIQNRNKRPWGSCKQGAKA